ncbi:hypothetical protein JIG36_28025 [Actinoplanes sp. LDG1-06]|uniref:Uncharacterized protein n=1 Tax=Paractinoplanes ovalisporus TaxID=2810368 RepID=A0ABS2AHV1_9ACTN|nr:hypothetical protein [Actinoplanes ovalisporus]MBM2619407.1 hypothetical protein [Actinoplanes ovalisporus]
MDHEVAGPEALEVVELARRGVAAIAPEEMVLFEEAAAVWRDGNLRNDIADGTPGGTARIGLPTFLNTALVFEIVTGALGNVLGNAAYAGMGKRRWWRRRQKPQATVVIDAGQRAALHAVCMRNAQDLGMSERKARVLADSVFGPILESAP